MDIEFPFNGWDTTHPRNQQPEGTSADLLNAMPFDRDDRGRGAVRSGISKFTPTQLGSGTQSVSLLAQVTRALDPASVVASTQLVNEPFTYANGTLNSVAGSIWSSTADTTGFTGVASNNVTVATNKVSVSNSLGGGSGRYLPSLTLGAAYILKATVTVTNVAANYTISLVFRGSGTGSSVTLRFQRTGSGGVHPFFFGSALIGDGTVNTPAGTVVNGVPFTIELHVNGNLCSGWLNGVNIMPVQTVTTLSGQSAVGFALDPDVSNTITLDDFQVFTAAPLASFRETSLVAVSGGSIYVGDSTVMTLALGGSAVLFDSIKPQMASRAGVCYFVDGHSNLKQLTLATNTVADIVPTAGAETATTLGSNTVICTWRDRLVVAAPASSAQNFFMSRQGAPTDWDYSQTDPAAAVAGNASKAGAIGEPLNCLMPWTDDILILGGDHSVYKVSGDIASGGQILVVSTATGTLGPNAWTVDPNGNLYFVGTGGLYKMTPGGAPESLSDEHVKDYFNNIDRTTNYVTLEWDRDRDGLWVHVTAVNTGTSTHLFYDEMKKAFFPVSYPNSHGPVSTLVFDGDAAEDRQLLLGGRDGYIRQHDPDVLTDDGTAITSYVIMGPYREAGDAAITVLEALEVMLGDAATGFTESDFSLVLTIYTGKDAYTVLTSPERSLSVTYTKQSRRKRILQRLAGGSFLFKITGVSGKLWSFEKLVAMMISGGLQRRY